MTKRQKLIQTVLEINAKVIEALIDEVNVTIYRQNGSTIQTKGYVIEEAQGEKK